ncbi:MULTISPECIES: hypothetical protein [Streptococcus]|uniref:Uncharacterized protein n=1 Tax=Streptococcus caledonicus TaxID=2614158 RepID=A0ABW0UEN7_9STRE|nr:hypothetical protein [Streptococcus sp. S784/96/1]
MGNHTYDFDITVNGRAEFELGMLWDYQISEGEKVTVWESNTSLMREKTIPTEEKTYQMR